MTQRSGQLVERIDGQNPIGRVAKGYTRVEHDGGVPAEELQVLLGTPVRLQLASESGVTAGLHLNDPAVAIRPMTNQFTAALVGYSDILVVEIDDVNAGTVERTWQFEAYTDDWIQLTAAAVGDTLAGLTTGLRIRAENTDIGLSATIFIGRTADNELLIQKDVFTLTVGNTATVRVHFDTFAGGIIGQRIAGLRAIDAEHSIALKTRSATKPADPTGISYADGQAIVPLGNAYVLASSDDPTGSDPLWYAFGTARFDHVSRMWSVLPTWNIVPADQTQLPEYPAQPQFYVRFGTSETGPWHHPREDGDDWAWARNADGGASVWPISDRVPERQWTTLLSTPEWTSASFPTGIQLIRFPFTPRFRLDDYHWFTVEFVESHGVARQVIIPANANRLTRHTHAPAVHLDEHLYEFARPLPRRSGGLMRFARLSRTQAAWPDQALP